MDKASLSHEKGITDLCQQSREIQSFIVRE